MSVETIAMNNLLSSHPHWGFKSVSINQALKSKHISHYIKSEYLNIMKEKYIVSKDANGGYLFTTKILENKKDSLSSLRNI
jgi:hypothetical protein